MRAVMSRRPGGDWKRWLEIGRSRIVGAMFGRGLAQEFPAIHFRTCSLRCFCDDHSSKGDEGGSAGREQSKFDRLWSETSTSSKVDDRIANDEHEKLDFGTILECAASKVGDEREKDDGEDANFSGVHPEAFLGTESDTTVDADGNDESEDSVKFCREFTPRTRFMENARLEADRVFEILLQDGLGFNFAKALDEMQLKVSSLLVREVLWRILKSVNGVNKSRCAKLAFKFFKWSEQHQDCNHNSNAYNLILKIFSECEELTAMGRFVDEMAKNGVPLTARTFNILICTFGDAGLRRKLVERFLKSEAFRYRPFKHSYNAILHSLIVLSQYRLIEWVYQKMLLDSHSPDILTYNVLLWTKFRLGKLEEFHRLLAEMDQNGFAPDLHTYTVLLHMIGKADKPLSALNLLNYMEDVGCNPRVLHFTSLIDGLSRAGNLDACEHFFNDMSKKGCEPDVVTYTVMITGYIVDGNLEKAQVLFDEMVNKGQLPNVFTYNTMIRGLCIDEKFDEACSMLNDMENRGCTPNFSVYHTIISRLRSAGRVSAADKIIRDMAEKGRYTHLEHRLRAYKRV